jgi:uncharacterized repeat protein (TIGR01451 family)
MVNGIARFLAIATWLCGLTQLQAQVGRIGPTAQSSFIKSCTFDAGGGPVQTLNAWFRTSIGGIGGMSTSASSNVVVASGFIGPGVVVQGPSNPPPVADLAVSLSDAPDPMLLGNNLVYSMAVTNRGPDAATGVALTSQLSGSVTFVSATLSQGSYSLANSILSCSLGKITNRGTALVTVTVTPNAEGIHSCTTAVNAAENDSDPLNNTARQGSTVMTRAPVSYVWNGSVSKDWFNAANWTPNGVPGPGDTATVQGKTVEANQDVTLADLNLTYVGEWEPVQADLSGTGQVTITRSLHCAYSRMSGSGQTTLAPGATNSTTFSGSGLHLDQRTFNNESSITLPGISCYNNAVFNNRGTISFVGYAGGSGTFNNYGRFIPTPLTTWPEMGESIGFNNAGIVEVQRGEFYFCGGRASGSFLVSPGATLIFFHSSYWLDRGSSVLSRGAVNLGQSTVTFNGERFEAARVEAGPHSRLDLLKPFRIGSLSNIEATVTCGVPGELGMVALAGIDHYEAKGGILVANTNLTITHLTCLFGALRGSGPVSIPVEGSLVLSNAMRLQGCTLNHSGQGQFFAQILGEDFPSVFNNHGFIELKRGGGFGHGGQTSLAVNNHGHISKTSEGESVLDATPFINYSALEIQSGSLNFPWSYNQTSGSTLLAGGNMNGASFDIQGGTLAGAGTITGNVINRGQLSPGASPGRLTIQGNYTQTASGVLVVEIGGPAAGTDFDQLQVTGTAVLNGPLNLQPLSGYVPGANEVFPILTCASLQGAFASVQSTPAGGRFFIPIYRTNAVELQVIDATARFTLSQFDSHLGQLRLAMHGPAGWKCLVEATEDFSGWEVVSSNAVPASSLVEYMETGIRNRPHRFFRAIIVP